MDSGNRKVEPLEESSGNDSTDSQPFLMRLLSRIVLSKEKPIAPVDALSVFYKLDHPRRGQALVFNHNTYFSKAVEARDGTDVDLQNIQDTFGHLGFNVRTYQDKKYSEIMKVLREVALENHRENDCLAIIVMTHGSENSIHAFDTEYPTEELWNQFTSDKCESLAGKPKLFFIQACRGLDRDPGTQLKYTKGRTVTDGPSKREKSYRIPSHADFLTVFSTVPGYVSFRNPTNGSAFVTSLCWVLKNYSRDIDLLTMMTLVNREVAINYESKSQTNVHDNAKKQMPFVCHTLMRQVYFFQKRS